MNTNLQWLEMPQNQISAWQINIGYAGKDFKEMVQAEMPDAYLINCFETIDELSNSIRHLSVLEMPDVLMMEVDDAEQCFSFIEALRKDEHLQDILIVLLSKFDNEEWKKRAAALKVHDFYVYPFSIVHLHERVKLLLKLRILKPYNNNHQILDYQKEFIYRMPPSKRLFDIVCSALTLLFLAPLLCVVALLVKLESPGPIIYRSKRVGTGYKVFDFYKFRSMQTDADSKVTEFQKVNMYSQNSNSTDKAVFFKVANDPRITKVGQFIRNTSIDELPQLFNILLGDMSFVGNRPLPLYEAELLTSNEWSMRFLGPAGLTGLWQITKRGKRDVSEQERKELDNYYAQRCSFWLDLKIILKTFPALIQKEQV
ncbi:sugar transferase [Mucilaginibacter sp. PAMB04168]|uniref:sugar transferase n=1 Tax=Mucilaginibacter sp. PAMB04168 TaxID=3138567 RepID=UPI0031F67C25